MPQKFKKIFCISDKDPGFIEHRKNAVFFKISLNGLLPLTQVLKKVKKAKPGLDPKSLRSYWQYFTVHAINYEISNFKSASHHQHEVAMFLLMIRF